MNSTTGARGSGPGAASAPPAADTPSAPGAPGLESAAARTLGAGTVLVAAALWGTVGPAQVLATSSADPGALGVARLLVGGLALAAFGGGPARWRSILVRGVRGWVLLAALATGVYQVTFMHAVDQLGAALGTVIALGVAPVATGLAALRWSGERITAGWAAGTAAAVLGCAILLNPWGAGSVEIVGVGLALVSGTCYGIYTVAAKRFLGAGAPAIPATSLTLVLAGAVLSPILIANPQHLAEPRSLMLVGWIGLAGTTAAYAAFVHGLHRVSAPTAGTLSLAEPLLAAALGVLVLHERLSAAALAGCVVLLAGLVAVTLADARRARAAEPPRTRRPVTAAARGSSGAAPPGVGRRAPSPARGRRGGSSGPGR